MSYWYHAFGLRIHCDLPLPAPLAAPAAADVVIRFGRIEPDSSRVAGSRSLVRASPQEVVGAWEGVGSFLVREGREIIVDPDPALDESSAAAWVQGTVLSALLHQRGLLVLHASAVCVGDGAVAFVGEVGWGKSTTAAAMRARGHRLLTDDLVALRVWDDASMLQPGFPYVKLMTQSLNYFGDNPEDHTRVGGDEDKRYRFLKDDFSHDPVPMRAIYVLCEGEKLEIEPLQPIPAMRELLTHAFVARMTEFLRLSGTDKSHFSNCTKLINQISINRLKRPRALEQLPQLAEMVEQHASSLQ